MPVYFRGASCAIIVFDVTNRESFNSLQYWINLAKDSGNADMNIVIAGTKCDLEKHVTEEEAMEFGREVGYPVIFCSAYNGENIENVFKKAAESSRTPIKPDDDSIIDPVKPGPNEGGNGGCC